MTWVDLVRKHFPTATDEEADYILWNETCFPFGKPEQVEAMLIKLKERQSNEAV